LEVVGGNECGEEPARFHDIVEAMLKRDGVKLSELSQDMKDAIRAAETDFIEGTSRERGAAWTSIHEFIRAHPESEVPLGSIAGIVVAGGIVRVVARGDDPTLDALVDELERKHRAVSSDVAYYLK
jgi:hypothetical protein